MSLIDELKSNVNLDINSRDLIEESDIKNLDVPSNLNVVKTRIESVLNFRNENQSLDPNMHELMDIMLKLNNDLAKDTKATISQKEDLKNALFVLYDNVVHDGLIGNKLADKKSNIYKMFEGVKKGLDNPTEIDSDTSEYLKVLSGVNLFQRQQLKEKNIVNPNDYEKSILANRENLQIPDAIEKVTDDVQKDIEDPSIMLVNNINR